MYQKSWSYHLCSWAMECDRHNSLSFWTIFCAFTPLTTLKIKTWKKRKKAWRSYDVWFLRHKEIFFFLGQPFDLPNNPKNQNFEKLKNRLEILSFYTCVPQMTSYGVCFLRHGVQQKIAILGHFMPFYPTIDPKN